MPRRRLRPAAALTAALILALSAGCALPARRQANPPQPTRLSDLPAGLVQELTSAPNRAVLLTTARVVQVLNGDELVLDWGGHLKARLIGVDAPESIDRPTPSEPLGTDSQRFAISVLQGREVRMGFGEVDRYDDAGRLWVYIYLPDGLFINGLMVRTGFARADSTPPNNSKAAELERYQRRAQREGRGIWSS